MDLLTFEKKLYSINPHILQNQKTIILFYILNKKRIQCLILNIHTRLKLATNKAICLRCVYLKFADCFVNSPSQTIC